MPPGPQPAAPWVGLAGNLSQAGGAGEADSGAGLSPSEAGSHIQKHYPPSGDHLHLSGKDGVEATLESRHASRPEMFFVSNTRLPFIHWDYFVSLFPLPTSYRAVHIYSGQFDVVLEHR